MKGVVDFYTELWSEVTRDMVPRFKWTFGVIAYLIASILIPLFAVLIAVTFIPIAGIFWLIEKLWARIKPFFFKVGV